MNPDTEAWKARQHDVTTTRTRKGRTTQRVTRFGAASVVGALDVDVNGRPLLSTSPRDEHVIHPSSAAARLLVRAAERGELRKRRHGLATLDIERITRDAYGDLIPPVLNGTEVRQFEQVIHRDRASSSAVTARSVGLDGGRECELSTMWISGYVDAQGAQTARVVRDDTIGAIVEQDAANAAQTETSISWPTRGTSGTMQHGRLAHEPRATDPRTRRVFRVASDGTCERVVIVVTGAADVVGLPTVEHESHPTVPTVVESGTYPRPRRMYVPMFGYLRYHVPVPYVVVNPGVSRVVDHAGREITRTVERSPEPRTVERLFNGHESYDRQAASSERGKRKARTSDETAAPTIRDAWEALIAKLAPNGRHDLGDITITRTAKGDYYCATVRADGASTRHRARTPQGLALKLTT